MATATLAHGFNPHLVAAHLGRDAIWITRESDYLFTVDCDQSALDAAVAAAVAGTPAPVPVPESVPAHHLRRALRAFGMLASVNAYMAALPADDEMAESWEYAPYFRRDANGIEAARVALGLSVEQVDALFVAAGEVVT